MPAGIINSPSVWNVGTVIAPDWPQNVQDNINAFQQGTVTEAGIVLDGTGGSSFTRSSTSPKLLCKDTANRNVFDFLGYPTGRLSRHHQDWMVSMTTPQTAAIFASDPRWSALISGGGTYQSFAPSTSYNAATLKIVPGSATGNKVFVFNTQPACHASFPGVCAVVQYELLLSSVTGNSLNTWHGLGNSGDEISVANINPGAYFKRLSTGNWLACTNDTNNETAIDTGITPVANTWQSFRVEYLNVSSGPVTTPSARFYINGALVATSTTTLPPATLRFVAGSTLSASSSATMTVGSVTLQWNRQASLELY